MRFYKKYFPKYRIPFLIAVTCVALEAFCDLLGPTLMARVINYGILGSDMNAVLRWSLLMLLVVFFGACFAVTRSILAANVSSRFGADIRRDVFRKILKLSEKSADKFQSGSLITRMTGDTSQVTLFANGIMRIFLKAPLTCIGSIVLATILNPRLSLVIYGVVAVIAVLTVISIKMSYIRFAKLQAALDKVNSVAQEYLLGIRLVKAFGTYNEEIARFENENENLKRKSEASQIVIAVISPVMGLIVGFGATLAIYFGSILFRAELIAPGDIAAFVAYMTNMLMSLTMIANIFNILVRAKASAERIEEVMESEEDFSFPEINQTWKQKKDFDRKLEGFPEWKPDGNLCFQNVTFSYPGGSGTPALRDLSFSVSAGETLAIIGPTGSGKSTICWLILRCYDVDSGTISLGGYDIHDLPVNMLRDNVAIAPQKPMLFSGTVRENILWGDETAGDDAVKNAAQKAHATEFIEDMPQGYDSILGRGGVTISGGQKQRISIARALIKNTSLLIIDDATSALDSITEASVRKELAGYPATKIIVTQRCTAAMSADKILVMENGKSAGFGNHALLMETSEVYKEIWQSQVDGKRLSKNQIKTGGGAGI